MDGTVNLDRRGLLQAGGFLALAFAIPLDSPTAQTPPAAAAKPRLPGSLDTHRRLDAWIRINADRTVTLLVGKVELGQGILTAVAQICADELDIDLARLRIVSGDTALVPDEGVTAGSFSMPNCASAVRQASAEVRQILLALASQKLSQPAESLVVADGTIKGAGETSTTYWDLVLGQALEREATGEARPKPAAQHRYIGKPVPRLDIPAKMLGEQIFVQELRPAGLLHGQVVRPPTYRAKLASLDASAVERMPGVVKVVRNGSFLAVVAAREEQAIAAAQALFLAAKWDVEKALPGHDGIFDWLLRTRPARDIEIRNQARGVGDAPARVIEATYQRPYHMHASIGTSTAVATLAPDGVTTIQTHSQSVFQTGEAIAKMLGVETGKVRCQHVQGSGCYGHNMADDAAADAALLAQAVPGRPVRVQYTRDHEHRWEPYGSAMVVKTRAGLDKDGNVLDWNLELWSTPHGTRPSGHPGNLLSATYLEKPFAQPTPGNGGPPNYAADRNAIALYEFPGHRVVTHFITEMPVRVSSTRGLGAYGNVFAIESFMDELAHAAGVDPVAYRLRFLKEPRARDALTKAAERFGWDKWEKRPNRGRGIAFARYKSIAAYCAVALEVEVTRRNGRVRVLRAVAANDSGHIVSPDGIANQIEGGLIQSLSWTLKEEVKFDDTRVTSEDWASYPILTFSEVPPVDVVLIDRPGAPFLGTGEASQGPTAAALANAIFDATGVRFRRVPFTPDRVRAGLAT
ncbi:MAG: xanthine dehydrogenase family protein molybdopterin-binding subunit [Alphaproteobacteria bacterium]|nr:xanthine dehydrogenase family protein molybdopterin-binding subunit [Alphaproteobacteria bacterium]